jgi:hypothetical protein
MGASAGTAGNFVNFSHVLVDPGATWTVEIAGTGSGDIITGSGGTNRLVFPQAAAIDLSGLADFPPSFSAPVLTAPASATPISSG